MRVLAATDRLLQAQRGHLFPWAPVCLGTGIAIYFALPKEPGAAEISAVLLAAAAGLLVLRLAPALSFAGWAALLVAAGFTLAAARANMLAAPVAGFRYYGAVEGRVAAVDRSPSDALRLTLDSVRLERTGAARTPARVRISLRGETGVPPVGARVMMTAHLMPPQGPAEPGGFDFRRHAWFQQLGAVGYTRSPVLVIEPPARGLWLERLRMAAAQAVRQRMPGETGAFAAAVTAGDRSGVGQQTLAALRASNLAHLLAISGLHMGLLAGFVFAAVRAAICLVPAAALRLPVKKLAAVAALAAAAAYLALSGGNVATERAFVMVAVMLCAVLLDRRALSLRSVALAAIIVLVRRPESLLSPGFQMSFAATAALVGVFGWIRDSRVPLGPAWLRPAVAVAISSLVAGLATAPFGAAHFNTLSHYGLIANLLAVPVMGTVVVPAAVLAACLAPIGLEMAGLVLMRWGLGWILGLADWAAGLDGAVGHVPAPGPAVLPLIAAGGLVLILWQGRARLLGAVPLALAALLWSNAPRPPVLIAADGGLVGVMLDGGRALSRARGGGYAARAWLENDGDAAGQAVAAARWPGSGTPVQRIDAGGYRVVHVIGKRGARAITGCAPGEIVVASQPVAPAGGCLVLDLPRLRATGSVAVTGTGRLITANQRAGDRMWTRAPRLKGQPAPPLPRSLAPAGQ